MIETKALPNGVVKVARNGFVFSFTTEVEDDIFSLIESTYGFWTNDYEEGAIAHEQHNQHSYNWFVPINIPTVKDMQECQILTENEAIALIEGYRQENYKRAATHGTDWNYYSLRCSVALDDETLSSIVLAKEHMSGVDDVDDKKYVNELMEDLIGDTLPKAFEKVAILAKAFSELKIGLNNPVEPTPLPTKSDRDDIDLIIEDLESYGATFIAFGLREHMTPAAIRKWVDDTNAISAEERKEFGLPATPLSQVVKFADQISERLLQNEDYK